MQGVSDGSREPLAASSTDKRAGSTEQQYKQQYSCLPFPHHMTWILSHAHSPREPSRQAMCLVGTLVWLSTLSICFGAGQDAIYNFDTREMRGDLDTVMNYAALPPLLIPPLLLLLLLYVQVCQAAQQGRYPRHALAGPQRL